MRCTEICHVRALVWFTVDPIAHRFNRALPSLLEGQRSTTVSSSPNQEVLRGGLRGEISAVPTGRPHAFLNMSPRLACPSLSGGAPPTHCLPGQLCPAAPPSTWPRCSPAALPLCGSTPGVLRLPLSPTREAAPGLLPLALAALSGPLLSPKPPILTAETTSFTSAEYRPNPSAWCITCRAQGKMNAQPLLKSFKNLKTTNQEESIKPRQGPSEQGSRSDSGTLTLPSSRPNAAVPPSNALCSHAPQVL